MNRIGDKIHSYTIIAQYKDRVVLATSQTAPEKVVVWSLDWQGDTCNGHYCNSLQQGMKEFTTRSLCCY